MWVIDGVRQGDVWTSTDGATLDRGHPDRALHAHAVVTDRRLERRDLGARRVRRLRAGRQAVFHSPDGVAWTRMADVPWSPRIFCAGLVFPDKVWLIDGYVRLGEVWKME